jgi:hypothetical protein
MATSAINQLYPLSSEDGKAIPLDIVLPLGVVLKALPANVHTILAIPAAFATVSIFATVDCVIDFTGSLSFPAPELLTSALVVHRDTVISALLPNTGNVRVIPLAAAEFGVIRIQQVQKWAGIGLARQLGRR